MNLVFSLSIKTQSSFFLNHNRCQPSFVLSLMHVELVFEQSKSQKQTEPERPIPEINLHYLPLYILILNTLSSVFTVRRHLRLEGGFCVSRGEFR
jgi:hypothetical protein